jgi:hypothetical protein
MCNNDGSFYFSDVTRPTCRVSKGVRKVCRKKFDGAGACGRHLRFSGKRFQPALSRRRAAHFLFMGDVASVLEFQVFQMRRCMKRCHRQGCKGDDLAVAADFLEHV